MEKKNNDFTNGSNIACHVEPFKIFPFESMLRVKMIWQHIKTSETNILTEFINADSNADKKQMRRFLGAGKVTNSSEYDNAVTNCLKFLSIINTYKPTKAMKTKYTNQKRENTTGQDMLESPAL